MKLRSMATAAVLGAVVLTAVPAVAIPTAAYACDGSVLCQDEDPYDDGNGGGGGSGGGGGGGGGEWGDPGGDAGGGSGGDSSDPGDGGGGAPDAGGAVTEVPDGSIGQPIDATLPQVVVTGYANLPVTPAGPGIPVASPSSGSGPLFTLYRQGRVWDVRASNCYRNQSGSVEAKYSRGVTYTVTTETSANISGTALETITAALNTKLNTAVTETYNEEFTLKPGASWAVYVEYQTSVYAITTHDFWGNYSTEYVNVTRPTGVVSGRAC
ncbi:DUF6426 family protein [Kitasatospora albolonga]|uniref:DUF6426 family protein n=1 Tax=Kitasatospora albolonga TaxID=68173 RepID=UPI0031F049B0